ncbi:MAG TPA: DUF1684 domain-containing protein [Kineosporiaceae bacterium]|nr:DUF1684 domain-containing protein [Kineosporiaceae bacterium]
MSLTLLDWRRQVHRLYADVRAAADPAEGHRLWRAGRDRLFAEHPDSPLPPGQRGGFTGLPVAAYDPALRFEVELDRAVPPLSWSVETSADGVVPFSRIGVAHLPGLGDLDVWWLESYGGGVFLPVRDAAPDTYGGGRYVLDTVKGADLGGAAAEGRLVVDLNFAYNPSCAYSPAWTCPLAPVGDTVPVALSGGERTS